MSSIKQRVTNNITKLGKTHKISDTDFVGKQDAMAYKVGSSR